MIERGSYRLATDALRRLRNGQAEPRRGHDRGSSRSIAGVARAEEVEARALDYLYGRRGTSVELLGPAERPASPQPRRGRPTRAT
jgi:hypothetical protein